MRIVSLIASATEIVCALGLRDALVGVSHECDYPPDVRGLPVLSRPKLDVNRPGAAIDRDVRALARDGLSVYEVDAEALERLQPDLIVTQDQCEVCAVSLRDVEAAVCTLTRRDTRVCTLHPEMLEDVLADIRKVGAAAGVPDRAESVVAGMRARLDALRESFAGPRQRQVERTPPPRPDRVACVEWLDPVMIAGGWMPELVRIAGGEPVIVTEAGRFRTVRWEDVAAADPDVVVVMPCGFDVARTRQELADDRVAAPLRGLRATREGRCFLADGNAYFNRPGPRLVESAEILAGLLRGERPEGAEAWT